MFALRLDFSFFILVDVSQDLECKGKEEHLRPGSYDSEKSVAKLPSDAFAVVGGIDNPKFSGASAASESPVDPKYKKNGKCLVASEDSGFQESPGDKKDSVVLPERGTPKDDDAHNSKTSLSDGILTAETSKPLSLSGKEAAAAISIRHELGEANVGVCLETEIKKMSTQSMEDINQKPTRLVPQIRPRSLSPVAEFSDGSKRPAVICDFFAKGWCIKGNSCRFLHIKDHVDIISQKPEGDVAASNDKNELQADEGGDGIERSRSTDIPDATASVACSSFPLAGNPSLECRDSPSWHNLRENHKNFSLQRPDFPHAVSLDSFQSPTYKDNASPITSSKDVGENMKQNQASDDYPTYKNSRFPELRSLASNSFEPSDTSQSTGIPSRVTILEDMVNRRSQFMLYDFSSPVFSGSLNSSLSPPIRTTGISPSPNISAQTRSSFSFGSMDKDPLGVQKLSDSVGEYRSSRSASLLRSSSPYSGFESENLSITNLSGDPLRIAGHRLKFSSNDWEPSVPFRPSFFITQSLSSPGSMYDPIRDSIEQPNLGDDFSKFSSRSETSITNTNLGIDSDPFLKRTLVSGLDMSDKNFRGKSLFTNEGETERISHAELKYRSALPKEEKLSSPAHFKDIAKASKTNIDSDRRIQNDRPRQKKEIKVDMDRQNNDIDIDHRTDGEQKESKALKYFRTALVDLVKELVKPSWREGHLSKDAHKMIVKKAVDKVLSTLQSHQTPSTAESVKQYLSASQPKISKLVEGYVVKYGRS
ncbi:hsp70 nucleotide exchange factor fes1 [Sarracenia purpurea var. burkii]